MKHLPKITNIVPRYSLVICKNQQNKFLCVQEIYKLWWIVGGKVQENQSFEQAAIRECKEEAQIDVVLKGLITFEEKSYKNISTFQRAIFYAEPLNESQPTKTIQDLESIQAKFLSIQQIINLRNQWRHTEIFDYPNYILKGGVIQPLEDLSKQIQAKKALGKTYRS